MNLLFLVNIERGDAGEAGQGRRAFAGARQGRTSIVAGFTEIKDIGSIITHHLEGEIKC